ncbi:MAG: hypothetical protein KJ879_00045 [Nanoarchaeota archaeon]|nr:hypothetical protein [Nanoarchaeota archaeon]
MKRGRVVLISFSLILILSLSLVSAGWFSDFFGKMTGRAVETQNLAVSSDPCDSDFDGNGTVDNNDYAAFSAHYNQAASATLGTDKYDLDGNGKIEFADYIIFAGNFGKNCIADRSCNPAFQQFLGEYGKSITYPETNYDLNHNGVIDFEDFISFTEYYSTLCTPESPIPAAGSTSACPDFNSDGSINVADFEIFRVNYGKSVSVSLGTDKYDLNDDGAIDFYDHLIFAEKYGTTCSSSSTTTITCTDSDGGKDYDVKGTVVDSLASVTYTDTCTDLETTDASGGWTPTSTGTILMEYSCGSTNYQYAPYECPNGCSDGTCLQEKSNLKDCPDFDGSGTVDGNDRDLFNVNYHAYLGKFVSADSGSDRYDLDGDGIIGFGDLITFGQNFGKVCAASDLEDGEDVPATNTATLPSEFYERIIAEDIADWEYVSGQFYEDNCPESDLSCDYYKASYTNLATEVVAGVAVLDFPRNIENDYFLGLYQDAIDEGSLAVSSGSSNKYYIVAPQGNAVIWFAKDKLVVTSFSQSDASYADDILDAYTGKYSSGFRPAEDTSIACTNSCTLDNECVPIGYRTQAAKFCDVGYVFSAQKTEGIQCLNSFECDSNFCTSGQCVDAGLMQRLLNWFKNVFGS